MLRRFGQYPGRRRVDQARHIRLGFGFVHRGLSRGIDNDIGLQRFDSPRYAFFVGQVAATILTTAIKRDQFTQRCEATLQFPANLAVFAE